MTVVLLYLFAFLIIISEFRSLLIDIVRKKKEKKYQALLNLVL